MAVCLKPRRDANNNDRVYGGTRGQRLALPKGLELEVETLVAQSVDQCVETLVALSVDGQEFFC